MSACQPPASRTPRARFTPATSRGRPVQAVPKWVRVRPSRPPACWGLVPAPPGLASEKRLLTSRDAVQTFPGEPKRTRPGLRLWHPWGAPPHPAVPRSDVSALLRGFTWDCHAAAVQGSLEPRALEKGLLPARRGDNAQAEKPRSLPAASPEG